MKIKSPKYEMTNYSWKLFLLGSGVKLTAKEAFSF